MYKIAICGKANSGKNTLAKLIAEQLGKQNITYKNIDGPIYGISEKFMAFADPIKEIVMIMFPNANKEHLYGPSHLRAQTIPGAFKNDKPLTYRQALLDIGTEVGRSYNDKIWLENFDHRYQDIVDNNRLDLVVITDVRFRNEFDHLKAKGFYTVRLYRDTGQTSEINHISETNQSTILDEEFDYVLLNNKSLEELGNEISCNIIPRLKR